MSSKICSKCGGDPKPISEFYETPKGSGKYRADCKDCNNKASRNYKANNRDKVSEYNKEYKEEHAEEVSEYNSKYNLENRDAIQKRQTKQHRERKKIDPQFNMAHKLRNELRLLIKYGTKKELSYFIVGCSHDFLMMWFEYQFALSDGMTLENHGELWHIDHVNPISNFDLLRESKRKKCFHWSNLRPMYAKPNQSKNGKIDVNTIEEHQELVEEFLGLLESLELLGYESIKPTY